MEKYLSTNRFNKGILDMIERHSYPVHIIKRNLDIDCTCVNIATNEANPCCKKCLGTGHKITIYNLKVASQDGQLPPAFRSDRIIVARNFYIPDKVELNDDDLIYDKGEIYYIFEYQEMIGLSGTIPYKKYLSLRKKFDQKEIADNFKNVLKRYKK